MSEEKLTGRVVVTYGRSIISLMIAQSLGSRGIEISGCDDVNMTVLSFSKFVTSHHIYTSPSDDEEAFIDDLLKIVEDNRPDDDRPYVLIPAFNDAKIIARHKQHFADKITVACPDYEMIDRVNPKDHFAKTAAELNVASPKTWMPSDEQELQQQLEEIEFPVFIKPPDDVGGRGISRVENADQLTAAYRDLVERYPDEQILIQGLAEGVDYCFCGLFDQGELKAQMVYHNLQKFPVEAGPGVVRETVDSERFAEQVQRLMKPLKWNGVAEIDFMWDEKDDSTPLMIEVNPRFWAGL
ncbi:MAG TPA: ATP-grasp domain-containing protein, partial [Chromatiaceae bacterium]|nr:ATP-grasp domain-containing protein [Chromatiaceae bacterium]